jgi:hypothetical protein
MTSFYFLLPQKTEKRSTILSVALRERERERERERDPSTTIILSVTSFFCLFALFAASEEGQKHSSDLKMVCT